MQVATAPDYKSLFEQSQLRIVALEQQLQQLQKMIFGSRHERFIPSSANDPHNRYEKNNILHSDFTKFLDVKLT
jgi:hypothetical protein